MDLDLDGAAALVTGGSRGIGLATAIALARGGARVAVSSRRQDAVDEAAARIRAETGAEAIGVAAHAGDPDAARSAVEATLAAFGACDLLVNNAATNPYMGPLTGISVSQADKTYEVNLRGPLVHSQAAWELWMRDNGGAIVNVASVGGYMVEPGIGFYNATKAALIHLTRQLARELAPRVRVNAVAPGLVKTDMARALWEPNEEAIGSLMPLGRLGVPDDVANAVVFLVSGAASWVTGHTLVVDGGAMLGR